MAATSLVIAPAAEAASQGQTCTGGTGGVCTVTFTTVGDSTWTVPAGVTTAAVTVDGAQGGQYPNNSGPPGAGAEVKGTLSTTPGSSYTISVGGAGDPRGAGGANGGGAGSSITGAGGGGYSALLSGSTYLLVAGGGGGSNGCDMAGGAGGQVGLDGTSNPCGTSATGGGGGRSDAGGAAGTSAVVCGQASGGAFLQGGAGGQAGGSGGGGGWFGGGGGGAAPLVSQGCAAAGGGGGSSHADPRVSGASYTTGAWSGNGRVVISYPNPVSAQDVSYTGASGSPLTVAAPGVLSGATGPTALTASVESNPKNGSVTLKADGSFSYTPSADFVGPDTFTYRATDNDGDYAVGTVTVTVNPVVTFDPENGDATFTETAEGGKVAEPAAPTRADYTFTGWFTAETGGTKWNFASDTVSKNLTLHAQWEPQGCQIVDGPSLQEAVDAAAPGGGTVTLCQDITYTNPDGPGLTIPSDGTVTLNLAGYTLDVTGGPQRAGIRTTGATLTISGPGTLNATGGSNALTSGSGIGGDGGDFLADGGAGGTVTINGGTVTATGGGGRGIGASGIGGGSANSGRNGGAGGTVTINRGTVTAIGGSGGGVGGSAIGGGGHFGAGSGGAGGTITIASGAVVNAKSGDHATAVVGSNGGTPYGTVTNSGTLALTGDYQSNYGTLTNTSTGLISLNALMLGSGQVTNDGTIRLTGGEVEYEEARIRHHAFLVGYSTDPYDGPSEVYAPSFSAAQESLPAPPSGQQWYSSNACTNPQVVTATTDLPSVFGSKTVTPDTAFDTHGNLKPNVTLYARGDVTVTFDANGGSMPRQSETILSGCPWAPRTTPGMEPRANYTFDGWSTTPDASSGQYDFDAPITKDVTLYAIWTPTTVTVTFNPENGEAVFTRTVDHGSPVAEPAVPARDGWVFGGWYSAAIGGEAWDFSAPVTGPLTLYAQWTSVTVDPDSVAQGGTVTVSGYGFWPGEQVHGVMHSTPTELGTFTADSNGDLAFTMTIPHDFPTGDHTVTLTGLTSDRSASAPLTVTAAPAASAIGPALADTGAPLSTLTGWALAMLLVGSLLTTAAVRLRSRTPRSQT